MGGSANICGFYIYCPTSDFQSRFSGKNPIVRWSLKIPIKFLHTTAFSTSDNNLYYRGPKSASDGLKMSHTTPYYPNHIPTISQPAQKHKNPKYKIHPIYIPQIFPDPKFFNFVFRNIQNFRPKFTQFKKLWLILRDILIMTIDNYD